MDEEGLMTGNESTGRQIIKNMNMKSSSFQFAAVQWVQHYKEMSCQVYFHAQGAKCTKQCLDSGLKQCIQKTEKCLPIISARFWQSCTWTILLYISITVKLCACHKSLTPTQPRLAINGYQHNPTSIGITQTLAPSGIFTVQKQP